MTPDEKRQLREQLAAAIGEEVRPMIQEWANTLDGATLKALGQGLISMLESGDNRLAHIGAFGLFGLLESLRPPDERPRHGE